MRVRRPRWTGVSTDLVDLQQERNANVSDSQTNTHDLAMFADGGNRDECKGLSPECKSPRPHLVFKPGLSSRNFGEECQEHVADDDARLRVPLEGQPDVKKLHLTKQNSENEQPRECK